MVLALSTLSDHKTVGSTIGWSLKFAKGHNSVIFLFCWWGWG